MIVQVKLLAYNMCSINAICPRSEKALRLSFPGPKDRDACLSIDMGGLGASTVAGQGVAAEIFTVTLGYPLLPSIFIIKPVFFWLHCEACGILVPYRLPWKRRVLTIEDVLYVS